MANRLKMAEHNAILGLARLGWSFRRIAAEVGVDRETVARHVKTARGDPPGSNAAIPIPGSAGQRSRCEPFRAIILAQLELGLTAQRIWQDLNAEHGFAGSYQSVQRFVKRLRSTTPLPFRRMECGPGEEAQVDFGRGAPIVTPEGKRPRPHLFRVVLSCSRKAYSEVVARQTTAAFLSCLENAFWYFGGVPKLLVTDYVAGHIIGLMFPAPLCGGGGLFGCQVALERDPGRKLAT
jgi:transposase